MAVRVFGVQPFFDGRAGQSIICRHERERRQTGDGQYVVGGQRAGKLQGLIAAQKMLLCQIEAALDGRAHRLVPRRDAVLAHLFQPVGGERRRRQIMQNHFPSVD